MKKIISISIFVSLLMFTILLNTTVKAVTLEVSENTAELCSDGIDNDFNTLVDLADSSCAAFAPVVENTAELCSDGIDNDFNTLVDLADPSCAAFAATTTPPTETSTSTATTTPETTTGGNTVGSSFGGGSSSGSSFGGGITSGTPVSSITTGTPISGISTSTEPMCADMFKTYMRKGKVNNVAEVKKLQGFLNTQLGLKIPTTGFFGNMTDSAVKAFQLKYKDSVLTPWGINNATGYFYKTTQRQANLLLCQNADIPMPVLN